MGITKEELQVLITAQDKTGGILGKLGGIAGGALKAGALAGGAAIAGIGVAVSKTIGPASDLNEAMNAVNVVFGDNAGTIAEWGKTAADTAGLSQAQFAQMAAQTGAMLQNFGLDATSAADETINLAQRAADMASIFNTDVDQALTAIQAGLRGEADPLEKFGVSLSAAAVKAKALQLGLADADGQLSNTALTQARLALLFEQTDKIAGDFVNTSGDLANASRVQAARWENFMASVGTRFLPIIQTFQGVFMDIAEAVFPIVERALDRIMPGIQRFADLIGQLIRVIMEMGLLSSETEEVLTDMFGADVAASIMNVLEFLVNLKNTIADFMTNVLIPFVQEHWEALKAVLIAVGAILAGAAIVSGIMSIVAAVTALLSPIGLVIAIVAVLAAAWAGNWGGIQEKTRAVIDFIRNIIESALSWIRDFWASHGEQIMGIVQNIWDTIVGIFEWFVQYFQTIFAAFSAAFSGDWETFGAKIREAWDMVWDAIKNIVTTAWENIKDAVSKGIQAVIDWFKNTDWKQVGIDVVVGIANGIRAGVQWAVDAIKAVASSIWSAIKGFFGADSPSKLMAGLGVDLMRGMAGGITGASQLPAYAAVGAGQGVLQSVSTSTVHSPTFHIQATINNDSDVEALALKIAEVYRTRLE